MVRCTITPIIYHITCPTIPVCVYCNGNTTLLQSCINTISHKVTSMVIVVWLFVVNGLFPSIIEIKLLKTSGPMHTPKTHKLRRITRKAIGTEMDFNFKKITRLAPIMIRMVLRYVNRMALVKSIKCRINDLPQ